MTRRVPAGSALILLLLAGGCDAVRPQSSEATPQPSLSAEEEKLQSGMPFTPRSPRVQAVVNAGKLPAYSGPFATIRGLITVSGDEAPAQPDVQQGIPADCTRARVVYEKLFREGIKRSAPDVLVSVTGYDKFVPVATDAVKVEGQGCAWQSRTIALTFGQRLEVAGQDERNYLVSLAGNQDPASLVALGKGKPVAIFPHAPGRYLLKEDTRPYMTAEVFVLKYPTVTVTGLDGRYTLTRVPPGKLTITAFLPQVLQKVDKTIDVQAGQTYDVDLTIPFSAARQAALQAPPAAPLSPTDSAPAGP
ncbi:MAG: carboxypeptidase-like regulatory domain-containing protein [Polyangiaceae bacterium]|nr:carboxypeptidase-like regulatory domain-containing protein [Polyangiaceae bacterium]